MKQIIEICSKLCEKYEIRNYWQNILLFITGGLTLVTAILLIICGIPSLPNANDLNNALSLHHALKSNPGFFETIVIALREAFKNAVDVYFTWGGTYSNPFFTTLEPFAFGSSYGFWHTIILVILNSCGLLYFIKVVLKDILGCNKKVTWIVYLLVWNLNVQYIPSPYSAFFWYNGSFYNTVLYSLGLVFFAMILKLVYQNPQKINLGKMLCLFVMSFIIGGGNYSTILLLLLTLLLVILDIFTSKKYSNRFRGQIVFVYVSLFAFFLLNVLAPGNFIRAGHYEQRNPIVAIAACFVYALRHILTYLPLPVILICILTSVILYGEIRKKKYEYKAPLLVLMVSFCLFASTYASVSYAEGQMPPIRQINFQYWFLILMVITNIVYFLGWLEKKYVSCYVENIKKYIAEETKNKIRSDLLVIFCLVIFICAWDPDGLTVAKACKDLGVIGQFKEELDERIAILEDDSIKDVEFDSFTQLPLLYEGCYDIATRESDEKYHWINVAFCNYYDKDSIWKIEPKGKED